MDRIDLPRMDAGGFRRLAGMLAPAGDGARGFGGSLSPGLILRTGEGGYAAMAARVVPGAAAGAGVAPAPLPGALRLIEPMSGRVGARGLWLVMRADGSVEAMDGESFGAFLAAVRAAGEEVALAPGDRESAEAECSAARPLALAS